MVSPGRGLNFQEPEQPRLSLANSCVIMMTFEHLSDYCGDIDNVFGVTIVENGVKNNAILFGVTIYCGKGVIDTP